MADSAEKAKIMQRLSLRPANTLEMDVRGAASRLIYEIWEGGLAATVELGRWIASTQGKNRDIYLFAELDGEIVGYISLTAPLMRGDGSKLMIGIDAAHRNLGIGTALLNFAIQKARAEGIGTLHLTVDRKNAVAKHVYEKAGFREVMSSFMSIKMELQLIPEKRA